MSKCQCNCRECICVKREYQNHSNKLRCLLGELEYKKHKPLPKENEQEIRYKNYHYNGSFHKGLPHDTTTGSLINNIDFENMRKGLLKNDQVLLNSVPLAPGSIVKLVNPLASLATNLIGAPQNTLYLPVPPTLSSDAGGADLIENYSMCMARDVPFINYGTDSTIATLLDLNHMNKPDILANLPYKLPGPFTPKTLFRGNYIGAGIGPYISQLLLLLCPMGPALMPQIYFTPVARQLPVTNANRVEWGINGPEMIIVENGQIELLPGLSPALTVLPANATRKYLFCGRGLAEAVHIDSAYQFYYQGANILAKLGAVQNPGFPVYANQTPFITEEALPSALTAISTVTQISLLQAWYYKWQVFRRLRPEVFSLWVDNVINGTVSNAGNYDISNVVFSNGVLADIFGLYGAYTLPQCFPEGSPSHPSYPAAHSVCAGANVTVLKILFDAERLWSSLPGVASGLLSGGIPGPIQADATGSNLVAYTDSDASTMTIAGELNKLAYNVGLGRDQGGVHTRSDSISGLELGEVVGIKFMEDCLSATVENELDGTVPKISFRKFNGELYTLTYTVCKKKKKKCC